ncbi:NAD(P)/FAD-dependent oxidoreductase [Halostreptopolyspora alba]|uniref:NAD(P)/FAD-dependent oxidoreductase n=1 Tax=Halostreptopolyspora alba TaxID=2487137 RepID=UPI0011CDC672
MYDVTIIGGGPAGTSAALALGRARRRTLLFDSGQGRNGSASTVRMFFSRDGAAPEDLRAEAAYQLGSYPDVETREQRVVTAKGAGDEFVVRTEDGTTYASRRLLLTAGVTDVLPPIPGLADLWGKNAVTCPYCHGWEVRDRPLGVIMMSHEDVYFSLMLLKWSVDVSFFTNGSALDPTGRSTLEGAGIRVIDGDIAAVNRDEKNDSVILLAGGASFSCATLFLRPPFEHNGGFVDDLGCRVLDDTCIEVDEHGQTSVPGVYAAGDLARRPSMPAAATYVVAAAAEGTLAALSIDRDMMLADIPKGTT